MFVALRQRNFTLLWVGQICSLLGDWALFMGLPFYVYSRTGSVLATGAMFIAQTLPYILLGSIAGVFADRWNRKRTMIIADVARALLLLAFFLLVQWPDGLWLIYPITFLETAIGQFYYPARTALIPQIVKTEHLQNANTLSGQTIALASLVGPTMGGFLAHGWGLGGVITVDSVSYLLSAACAWLMTHSGRPSPMEVKPEKVVRTSVLQEWRNGLHVVIQVRSLRVLFTVMGLITITQGINNVLMLIYVERVLHAGAQVFGWLATALGIGSLIGGFFLSRLSKKVSAPQCIFIGACVSGLCLLVRNHLDVLLPVILLTAFFGGASLFASTSEQTLLQIVVHDEYRGRVFGTWSTAQAIMMLIGMLIATVLGNPLGVVLVLDGTAILLLVAALLALLLLQSVRVQEAKAPSSQVDSLIEEPFT